VERRDLMALSAASALVTLEGGAVTMALPAIAQSVELVVSQLQWISLAHLVAMSALLLPGGALADRLGYGLVLRVGMLIYAASATLAATSTSGAVLIAARALQGGAAALVLPCVVAMISVSANDSIERARRFGVWAAWTGAAGVVGPFVGAAASDMASWRAIFAMSVAVSAGTFLLLRPAPPKFETRQPSQGRLLRAVLEHRNCLSANATTFAWYAAVFGLTFLIAAYTQEALGYSALMAAAGLLPASLALLLSDSVSPVAMLMGTRRSIVVASLAAGLGIAWIAAGPHPLPFWSHLVPGMTLFGLGIAVGVSPLTHAAICSLPVALAGAGSGLHHATVRVAGLAGIAIVSAVATQDGNMTREGFRGALLACGSLVSIGGSVCGLYLRDDESGGLQRAL
jgi:predicted MFS family arabinose efflux permease